MARDRISGYPPNRRWIDGTVNGSTTLTRPSDIFAYSNGDEISDNTTGASAHPWVFANVGRQNGGQFTILRTVMRALNDNNSFTNVSIWFYTATITMSGDNVGFSHIAADDANFVDRLAMTNIHSAGTGTESVLRYANTTLVYGVCAAADTSLYGVLINNNSITPISAETIKLRILVEN